MGVSFVYYFDKFTVFLKCFDFIEFKKNVIRNICLWIKKGIPQTIFSRTTYVHYEPVKYQLRLK